MDDDDFARIKRQAGEGAMAIMAALDQAEVQEALEAWSEATFGVIRALERADLDRHSIAGMLGGSVIDTLQRMADDD